MATALQRAHVARPACRKWAAAGVLGLLIFGANPRPALAGDSLYGKVSAVKRADLVTVDIGTGAVEVCVAGVVIPREGARAEDARKFVSDMALGKNARLRLDYRDPKTGALVGRLQTDEPEKEMKDVGLELVRAGLVRRQSNYDYKYRELSAAETEAKRAKRGVWAGTK